MNEPKICQFSKECDIILETLNHPEAYVSDESSIGDFVNHFDDSKDEQELTRLSHIFKTTITLNTRIVDLCEFIRLRDGTTKNKFPFLIVTHEKHFSGYFLMTCQQDVFNWSLFQLKSFHESGYYGDKVGHTYASLEDFVNEQDVYVSNLVTRNMIYVTIELLNEWLSLKDDHKLSHMSEYAKTLIQRVVDRFDDWNDSVRENETANNILNEHDGEKAWKFLNHRSIEKYEYETFDVVPFDNF